MKTVVRKVAGAFAAGLLTYACATSGGIDNLTSPVDAGVDATADADADPPVGCGMPGQACCDAGCADDASFCSANNHCLAAHPTDVGAACTTGANCQSGLCSYLQDYDAATGANPPAPTVCSAPCWVPGDCLSGWSCAMEPHGPIVTGAMGPGTCVCEPVAETCDGRDDNCDGVIDEEPGASAACSAILGAPATCADGGCTCTQQCDGGCVNLTDDSKNCGACGKVCTPGLQVCSNSECVCGGTLCPIPDGGIDDAGYIVPEGGPGGKPAACTNIESDPRNCGGCGLFCAYTCSAGCVPRLLATLTIDGDASFGTTPVGAVASNGSELFILTGVNGGVVAECSVAGCNKSPTVIATGLNNTNNTGTAGLLALGGGWAYWPGATAVEDLTTTNPAVSVFAQPAGGSVFAVATNATQVFWSDTNLGILSCALGATCAVPNTIAARAGLPAAPQALAADASNVYWLDANGDLLSAAFGGGSPVVLAGGNDAGVGSFYPVSLVAAAGRVYYIDPNSGQLMTATGGTASSATVYFADSPTALATDGTSLYWADGTTISKCALGASCPTTTEIYGTTATALTVDATNIYWIDTGSNASGVPNVWEFHK